MSFFSSIANFFSSAPAVIGAVGLAAAATTTFLGYKESKQRNKALDRAAEARNKAVGEQRKQNTLRLIRQKRETIRQARIARARAVSAATAQGAAGSVRGGFGSIFTQAGSNIGFLEQSTMFANQGSLFRAEVTGYATEATQHGTNASIFSGLTNISGTIFKNREDIVDLFR